MAKLACAVLECTDSKTSACLSPGDECLHLVLTAVRQSLLVSLDMTCHAGLWIYSIIFLEYNDLHMT